MRRIALILAIILTLSCDKGASHPGEDVITVAEGILTVYRMDTSGDTECDTGIISAPPGALEIPGDRFPLSEPIDPGDYTDVLFRYDYGTFMLLVGFMLDTTDPGDPTVFNYSLASSDSLSFVGDTFYRENIQYFGPVPATHYYVAALFSPAEGCPVNGMDSAKVYYRVRKFK